MNDQPSTQTIDQFYEIMAKALYLTPEDIQANRTGYLSDNQIARVRGQMRAALIGVGCIVFFSILPAIALALVFQGVVLRAVIIGGLGILAWVFLRSLRFIRSQRQSIEYDLKEGRVAQIEGLLQKKATEKRAGVYLGVRQDFFLVPQVIYDHAPVDVPVVIYYLPITKQFIALEFLEQ